MSFYQSYIRSLNSGPLSAPPIDNNANRERDQQFFFGRDFSPALTSTNLLASSSCGSAVGSSSLSLLSPALVPNSFYSLSDLRSSGGLFGVPPLSAPPPPPPLGNSSIDGGSGGGGHREDNQFFFGRDFNAAFETNDSGKSGSSGNTTTTGTGMLRTSVSNSIRNINNTNSSENARELLGMEQHQLHVAFNRLNLSAIRSVRKPQPTHFSLKIFLGGIPTGVTTSVLQLNFAKFGKNVIDWPKKTPQQDRPPNGYAFVVYEDEESIFRMLRLCFESNGRLFYSISTFGAVQNLHPVEIKVWEMKDTSFVGMDSWRKNRRFSVFVGGIPRTCTAGMLANGIQEVIGPVAYCTIELDRQHFYPKGAACVVFTNKESYIKAIAAHDVVLSFVTFERKVEFKPFLASNMPCEKCACTSGTRFCAEMICLAYYCSNCWDCMHSSRPSLGGHIPSKRFDSGRRSCGGGR